VEEQGRQRENRNDVRPVEHPVQPVEPSAERKGEHAEERNREPEEVKRRGIAWTPQPDRTADEQCEDANRRQDEVQRTGTRRHRSHTHIDDFTRTEPERRVAKRLIASRGVQDRNDVGHVLHRTIIYREEHIAAAETDSSGRRIGCDFGCHHALGLTPPKHTVFDFVP
jgi:hypothetical protein